MIRYWKIIILALMALAIALGIIQRQQDPYTTRTFLSPYAQESSKNSAGDKNLNYFYQKSQELSAAEKPKTTVSFLAVGDIMLSRNVAGTALKANDPLLPFRKMEAIFNSVDFSFGNLESPFSGKDGFNPSGSMIFNAPRNMVQGLIDYKFKILTLANNHALDQGKTGVDYTLQYLKEKNIKHVGLGKTLSEAWQPAVISQNGIKICFIGASYSSINDSGKIKNDYVARIDDLQNLQSSISNLQPSCDFIVAAMHAGTEYTRKPNKLQIDFARAAIDAGADMVIGHHPHWIQTFERYNGKYIFCSLGNFIFDQEWSRDTKEGLALKIKLSKPQSGSPAAPGAARLEDLQGNRTPAQLDSIELIPVIIENYSTPRPATAEETKKILQKIEQTDIIIK